MILARRCASCHLPTHLFRGRVWSGRSHPENEASSPQSDVNLLLIRGTCHQGKTRPGPGHEAQGFGSACAAGNSISWTTRTPPRPGDAACRRGELTFLKLAQTNWRSNSAADEANLSGCRYRAHVSQPHCFFPLVGGNNRNLMSIFLYSAPRAVTSSDLTLKCGANTIQHFS